MKTVLNLFVGIVTQPSILVAGCKLIPETTFKRGYNE